jgi:ribosomal protein S18 acetylase RimI-like enzyme
LEGLIIADVCREVQEEARWLVLAGLEEHWGWLDLTKNPDLDDIVSTYAGETFLTARLDGALVGTGALVREEEGVGRVVRMSVAKDARRSGLGREILRELCRRARQRGFRRLVLETTETWEDAIGFYRKFGFRFIEFRDGDAHFTMDLDGTEDC